MKAIIVTGSRHWTDEDALFTALIEEEPDVIIHGDCPTGADAMMKNIPGVVPMPAQWDKHGNYAGPKRNSAMLQVLLLLRDHGYEVAVVAAPLPDGRGTQDMMRKAEAAGVRVRKVQSG